MDDKVDFRLPKTLAEHPTVGLMVERRGSVPFLNLVERFSYNTVDGHGELHVYAEVFTTEVIMFFSKICKTFDRVTVIYPDGKEFVVLNSDLCFDDRRHTLGWPVKNGVIMFPGNEMYGEGGGGNLAHD
jgi:hypothetical protein